MLDKQIHRNEFKLRLLLTNECNRKCQFCLNDFQDIPNQHNGVEPQYLDSNIAANAMVAYTRMNTKYPWQIYFSGGEPTLHKHLPLLIEKGKKLKARLTLNTNGSFIGNKLLTNLFKRHIHCNHFGIYHASEDLANLMVHLNATMQCVYSRTVPYVNTDFLRFYMRYNIPIKIFCDLYDSDTEDYVNFIERLKMEYPEYPFSFRHTGIQENRGPGCTNCDRYCVTLKGAWVFPDGGVSHCPQKCRGEVYYPNSLSDWMDSLIEIEKLHATE